ncbi:MAG TPA: zinc-binding dehydrogenase, partial [Polyangiaceae bacterium]|nr:zinc-binding dehydrogenase [Polyangiaceae bacterium]
LIERFVAELQARPEDDEVLLTKAGRFVNRVRPAAPAPGPSTALPCVLTLRHPGRHYALEWRSAPVPEPGPGQLVVEVRAASLNYRDVMVAMGLVPVAPERRQPSLTSLGSDFAGTVTAVGPGVSRFAPGDRVAGVAAGCLGTHVVAHAARAFTIPDGMTFAEAATMPVVFLTALHGLKHLARLAPGETALVHGAAGGVGLAALQVARQLGAKVIATAGTPAKRDLLRLLGVEHVLDSRGLRFAEDLRELTGGEGVDVVLNSLAGEGMLRSLRALKPYGRFVELGKRDFLEDNSLPLAPFLHNVAFFGVDLSAMIAAPSPLDARVDELREALQAGLYRPLPLRRYAAA